MSNQFPLKKKKASNSVHSITDLLWGGIPKAVDRCERLSGETVGYFKSLSSDLVQKSETFFQHARLLTQLIAIQR